MLKYLAIPLRDVPYAVAPEGMLDSVSISKEWRRRNFLFSMEINTYAKFLRVEIKPTIF